jgi:hypothetical protein
VRVPTFAEQQPMRVAVSQGPPWEVALEVAAGEMLRLVAAWVARAVASVRVGRQQVLVKLQSTVVRQVSARVVMQWALLQLPEAIVPRELVRVELLWAAPAGIRVFVLPASAEMWRR